MAAKITLLSMRGGWTKRTHGKVVVNCTSRGNTPAERGLSPFLIGPCQLYRDFVSKNMENGWQYSKVYHEHIHKGRISPKYWDWAKTGWNASRAERYPMGRGRKPEFSLWDGDQLDYIEARKNIYVPLYAKAVMKTQSWKWLKNLYEDEREIFIVDFDAYDHREEKMSLTEVLNCPERKMGHGFVLAMLLRNDPAIEQTALHL